MRKFIISLFVVSFACANLQAQQYQSTMEFLTIATDAKGAGAGNTGMVSAPDINSHQWNPAKYIFLDNTGAVSLFYAPQLRNTGVKDMYLTSLSGFYKFDSLQTISSSLRYYSQGDVDYYSSDAQFVGVHPAYEMAFDAAYSRRLSRTMSASVALRYVYSSPISSSAVTQSDYKNASAFATDLSVYYFNPLTIGKLPADLSFGLALTNLGTKVSYGQGDSYFLPTQLKFGGGLSLSLNSANKVAIMAQVQKYLVPTDSTAVDDSALSGVFSSFGSGGLQGMIGAQYSYLNMLHARIGYFGESVDWGNRKYMTFGLGGRYNNISLDIAYLVGMSMQESSMSNTLQISLAFDFPWKKK